MQKQTQIQLVKPFGISAIKKYWILSFQQGTMFTNVFCAVSLWKAQFYRRLVSTNQKRSIENCVPCDDCCAIYVGSAIFFSESPTPRPSSLWHCVSDEKDPLTASKRSDAGTLAKPAWLHMRFLRNGLEKGNWWGWSGERWPFHHIKKLICVCMVVSFLRFNLLKKSSGI